VTINDRQRAQFSMLTTKSASGTRTWATNGPANIRREAALCFATCSPIQGISNWQFPHRVISLCCTPLLPTLAEPARKNAVVGTWTV
jgi:hypothetical protein